jgi:DNA-binding NarL/FixJ family response regulator
VRVVIAEDSALLRAGLATLMAQSGFDVVGEAGRADGLLDLVRTTMPDVVVLDIRMPPTNTTEGLVVAQQLRAEHGNRIGIVLLSHHVETTYAVDLLAAGASGIGYLLKDRILDPAELVDAINRVAAGGSAIDPVVIERLLKRSQASAGLSALTTRELEVLAGMAEGRSNSAIGRQLFISDKTVEACTGRIFGKLGLEPSPDDHRRVRAVIAYLEQAQRLR